MRWKLVGVAVIFWAMGASALRCEFLKGTESGEKECPLESGKDIACMAVWTNGSHGRPEILHKGCWHPELQAREPCEAAEICTATRENRHKSNGMVTYFCCCKQANCNGRIQLVLATRPPVDPPGPEPTPQWLLAFLVVAAFLALGALLLAAFWLIRRRQYSRRWKEAGATTATPSPAWKMSPLSPTLTHQPIQLDQIIARGRYGNVWKARLRQDLVAVKVFPAQDVDSWMQEQDVYALEGMRAHPNILTFLGAEEWSAGSGGGSSTGGDAEYWLISELHHRGSLCDYLKAHTLSESEALTLILTTLRGLAFLHEEMETPLRKPTIVHRDLKSKNILVKADMTACIGDFGLAMQCSGGRTGDESHGQVGTRRYMAPEVLEGATEFSAFAFRQIDVYAAALIIWECLCRTRLGLSGPPEAYKLPFEEEIGAHPSLADMQSLVVQRKKRPILRPNIRQAQPLLAATTEEMWDSEPDARITASCALERLSSLAPTFLLPASALNAYTSLQPFPLPPLSSPPPPSSSSTAPAPDRAPLLTDHPHLPV